MPKISAPTIPEHRTRQRQVLLDAARDVLIADGAAALTFATVAAAAGLARNSVYEYFADRTALIVAVVAEEFPKWDHAAKEAMAAQNDPTDRVLAYARVQLELVAAGEHRVALALRGVPLTGEARKQFRQLHAGLTTPLRDALAGRGDTVRWTDYIQAVIDAATTQLEGGDDPDDTIASALTFLRAALR